MNIEDKIQTNVTLAGLTTFKIGGNAAYFVAVDNLDDLSAALMLAKTNNWPVFVLGGGSNLLVSDQGWLGLVIKIANNELTFAGEIVRMGAGVPLPLAVIEGARHGLSGLEWAVGVPGLIGGAIRGNSGAYGGEMKDSVVVVRAFDRASGQLIDVTSANCDWSYRSSLFKMKPELLVWSVDLKLKTDQTEAIQQRGLEILRQRLAKLPKAPSAGSVFKNIELNLLDATVRERLNVFVDKFHGHKLGAGVVIESLGFKGKQIGGAMISEQHSNFIVNQTDAKASEVYQLLIEVQAAVYAKYGLQLEPEIELVGEFK